MNPKRRQWEYSRLRKQVETALRNAGNPYADDNDAYRLLRAYFLSRGIEFKDCSTLEPQHCYDALVFLEAITVEANRKTKGQSKS